MGSKRELTEQELEARDKAEKKEQARRAANKIEEDRLRAENDSTNSSNHFSNHMCAQAEHIAAMAYCSAIVRSGFDSSGIQYMRLPGSIEQALQQCDPDAQMDAINKGEAASEYVHEGQVENIERTSCSEHIN